MLAVAAVDAVVGDGRRRRSRATTIRRPATSTWRSSAPATPGLWTALLARPGRPGAARRRHRPVVASASGPAGATVAGARRCCPIGLTDPRVAPRPRGGDRAPAGDVRHGRRGRPARRRRRERAFTGAARSRSPTTRISCAGSRSRRRAARVRFRRRRRSPARPPTRRRRSARPPTSSARSSSPHCAAVHPLQLAHAVAAEAARTGCASPRASTVDDVGPRRVVTDRGTVRADVVVLATEAYTAQLPGRRRELLPIYSMMIGSEPLSATQWAEIGLADRPTFTERDEHDHLRPAHGRWARSRSAAGERRTTSAPGSTSVSTPTSGCASACCSTIRRLFPPLRDVEFPFHWGGPLGVPRDWHPHATLRPLDRARQRGRLRG